MAKIGIFWIYKSEIMGKSRKLEEGQENLPGMIDSPDTHIELWEKDPYFIVPFPELKGSEYQSVPRGRVLYSAKDNKIFVYMDKVLHSEDTKKIIVQFFQINDVDIVWRKDPHYTTEQFEIDALFNDNECLEHG